MKTFLRKLKLSFVAMLCGWIACNIAMWILAGYDLLTTKKSIAPLFDTMLVVGLMSGLVILGVWLVIFLPVDLLVPDHSQLRKPKTAACTGFGSAFAFVLVYLTVISLLNPSFSVSAEVLLWFVLLPGITGTVAAYVRARMDKPKPSTAL